jgi:hypothetical protein
LKIYHLVNLAGNGSVLQNADADDANVVGIDDDSGIIDDDGYYYDVGTCEDDEDGAENAEVEALMRELDGNSQCF